MKKTSFIAKTFAVGMLLLGFILLFYSQGKCQEYENSIEQMLFYQNFTEGDLLLADTYDSNTSSFSDFIRRSNALEIEARVYESLISSGDIRYYDIARNPVYYVGHYEKYDHAQHEYINDEIEGRILTACCGISIGQAYFEDNDMSGWLRKGRLFEESEFEANVAGVIPVILGSSYDGAFVAGEEFTGRYVVEDDLNMKVVGFLEKGAWICAGGREIVLDDYMIIPSLSVENIGDERDKVILLSTKIEGYAHYRNAEEYQAAADAINRIAADTGFQYYYIVSAADYEDVDEAHYKVSRNLQYVSAVFLGIGLLAELLVLRKKGRKGK